MGLRSKVNFIIRTIILLFTIGITIFYPELIDNMMDYEIIFGMNIFKIFWIFLMSEMIVVLIPKWNKFSYCGKHLGRHYIAVENYNEEKLKKYTKKNNIRALRALVFWVVLNGILATIYYTFDLHIGYVFSLFIFYYWSDMFCVNFWCPFHKIIVGNKCCNECRIYNWGHIMYVTPLILINSFWTYSIVFVALVIAIQWEYNNFKYPERFSPISNKKLRCGDCENNCRFNKKKL